MEKNYEAIMEDFDRKCQDQYNQRRDRSDLGDQMKASRYERQSDDESDSEEGHQNWQPMCFSPSKNTRVKGPKKETGSRISD